MEVCERGESEFKLLYPAEASLEDKITTISKEIYGADGIELSELARKQLETYTAQGYAHLPSVYLSVTQMTFHGPDPHPLPPLYESLHGQDTIFVLARPETQGRADR